MTKITRRRALQLGAGSLLSSQMFSASRAKAQVADVDVVIIGAGIAGLAAARRLVDLDYTVVVLEAAAQIGGRIKTDRSLGAPFEMGAGWIHGPKGNPISALAKQVAAPTKVTNDESYRVFSSKGEPIARRRIEKSYDRLMKIYDTIDGRFDADQPLLAAIEKVSSKGLSDPVLNWMASAYTEFDSGGPLNDLSAYYFDEDKTFDGQDVVFPEGYDRILAPLVKGLDIRLNTPALSVEYAEGEGATVHTPVGEFDAYFVICTAPLGVLKQQRISFDPPLPRAHRRSIEKIAMGNVTKLALKFDQLFWPRDTQYFGLMTQTRGRWNYFLNYRTFSDENILLGVSVGSYAAKVEALSDAEMVEDAMQAVRTMFGNRTVEPTDYLLTRWSKDPWTMGAYSYVNTGTKPDDFEQLTKPVANTVLFAGEHTHFDYHSTTHGAYLSGIAAAQLIEDELAE